MQRSFIADVAFLRIPVNQLHVLAFITYPPVLSRFIVNAKSRLDPIAEKTSEEFTL